MSTCVRILFSIKILQCLGCYLRYPGEGWRCTRRRHGRDGRHGGNGRHGRNGRHDVNWTSRPWILLSPPSHAFINPWDRLRLCDDLLDLFSPLINFDVFLDIFIVSSPSPCLGFLSQQLFVLRPNPIIVPVYKTCLTVEHVFYMNIFKCLCYCREKINFKLFFREMVGFLGRLITNKAVNTSSLLFSANVGESY